MSTPTQPIRPGVFLLTNTAAVYRLDLYNALARSARCRFHAAFWALDDPATAHCRGPRDQMAFDWSVTGSPALPWPGRPGWPVRGLADTLESFGPRVLVAAGANPLVWQALATVDARRCRRVLWWGGTALSEAGRSRWRRLWLRHLFGRADGVIAYSEQAAEFLQGCGVASGRILVLGNLTFDVETRVRDMGGPAPQPARGVRLLAVGQLSARKNLAFLLEVFARLRRDRPDLRLEIVGDGPERASLEQQARDGGGGVDFLGRLDNRATLERIRQAQILVHPARMDQWPQVINEALTAGLPVVASTASGLSPRVVRDGGNGWLLDLETARWVQVLESLVSDPELRMRMGQASLDLLEDYRLEHSVGRLLDFVLEGHR